MSESSELEVPLSPGLERKPSKGKGGTGIVRKRSVRRCISTGKEEALPLRYGRRREEYDRIVEQVLEDKQVEAARETLEDRWKMIMIMYDDCMEMVTDWEERQQRKAGKTNYFQVLIAAIMSTSALIPVVCIVYKWG